MRSILRYVGRMEDVHIKEYMSENTGIYVEPFAGSFNCGFNLMVDGFYGAFVLSDIDKYVYTFWKCVKEDAGKLYKNIVKQYEKYKDSETFKKDIEVLMTSDDEYDIATYEYLFSISDKFSNKPEEQSIQIKSVEDDFIRTSTMLSKVNIANRDYRDTIRLYDTSNTLFLLDPPYNTKNVDRYYRGEPSNFNHKELRAMLDNIHAEFIIRYKKDEYIDELYSDTRLLFSTEKKILGHTYIENYYTNIKEHRT